MTTETKPARPKPLTGNTAVLAQFTINQVESGDIDPVYPVLKSIVDATGSDREEALWLAIHYLTFYNLSSGVETWLAAGRGPADAPPRPLPCATERRGNRVPANLDANMRSWTRAARKSGGLDAYLFGGLPADPGAAWVAFRRRVEAIDGNGRWASYKLAEIMTTVFDANLRILDMGHAQSTGPRKGLRHVWPNAPDGNSAETVAALDDYSARLTRRIAKATGLELGVEHVETMLCDFHALLHGDYYTGRDIDVMLEATAQAPPAVREMVLAARSSGLPHAYLGELHGWAGVDRARKRAYKMTGQLVTR